MASGKVTKRTVDTIARSDRDQFLWDDELKGFGLLVLPSGVKTYIANYRVGGRLQRQTIGRHGVLTPEQARDRARKILGTVADGRDPVAEKRSPGRHSLLSVDQRSAGGQDGHRSLPSAAVHGAAALAVGGTATGSARGE